MITPQTIQAIQDRVDVLDVVGNFVRLKRRGANYLGLCPFHNERTPSFTVSPAKGIYKCFGCGKSGNSISFVMEHEKFTYVEAMRWLAARYQIEVQETAVSAEVREQQQTSESLYIINKFAQQFFEQQLFDTEEGRASGLSYLESRGFTEDTLRKFGVGYNPDKRDTFASAAFNQKYNRELTQKAGLIAFRNNEWVDNYRDRIIFPIHNPSGRIIGFGARLIKKNDKAPKYINTPENELYVKSKILYGLYFARQAIDKFDECLLVEGYTDVLSLHQAGVENVVASGGTSLTTEQLRLIKKYTKNLTIVYDGDGAGIKAALRGLDMALEEGLNVKLVLVPDGEDPDSYVQKVGANEFRNFIAHNKKDVVLFQLEVSLRDAGDDAARKAAVVNQIAETIAKIDRAEDFTKQQDYIRLCAQLLRIDESGFTNLVNKFIRDRIVKQEQKLPFEEANALADHTQPAEPPALDDHTFQLLFKNELQEREIARVLIEHGVKHWNDQMIAEFVLHELPEDELFENHTVLKVIHAFRDLLANGQLPDKNVFIYHPDSELSAFAVSLLQFPYEESKFWKSEAAQSSGYQKSLFEQSWDGFKSTVNKENPDKLGSYLLTQRDTTHQEVESALVYLKLRQVRRLLLQNQADLEKAPADQQMTLLLTHQTLKQMERELTDKTGTVVIR
ncbi:DNA primase [Flaviaesturariibacter aridisoli]|uniref:DNA primase n=1 Tax=Flaviaesturariibacter aridisoli TaxID=2545761 RepID=A0A4R4E3C7_9BACT|nr:DNA primase [Flaviaesturariibacter aridisoli]TCZ73909.1 DNA primase [Flaviaesturariibacter aridisoli]